MALAERTRQSGKAATRQHGAIRKQDGLATVLSRCRFAASCLPEPLCIMQESSVFILQNQALVDREGTFILLSASHSTRVYPYHCHQQSILWPVSPGLQ